MHFALKYFLGDFIIKRIPRRGMKSNEKKKKYGGTDRQTEQDKWTWWGENYTSWVALVEKSCFSLYHTQVFMKVVRSFAVLTRQLKKSLRSSEGHRFQTHDLPSPSPHPPTLPTHPSLPNAILAGACTQSELYFQDWTWLPGVGLCALRSNWFRWVRPILINPG